MKNLIFSLVFLLLAFSPLYAQEHPSYTFALVPQQSATALARAWGPIFLYLSDKTGFGLVFKTAKNIPAFEEQCAAGAYDIAYMNPYHYTVFHKHPGYVAFARQKDKMIQGVLVAPKDSPITDLAQLAGEKIAFPAPAAFAASVLPRAHFQQAGVEIEPVYVSSHDSVYLSISKGLYPAGGGIMRTLEAFGAANPAARDSLQVLWRTEKYTPHAFAAHPRVPPEHAAILQKAMTDMDQDPNGRELLKTINFNGIQPAKNADWDDVRSLGVDMLSHVRGSISK